LVVDLIEQGHLLIVGKPVVFQVLLSSLAVRLDSVVVGVSYGTSELHSRLGVAFYAIYGVHQPSMNL
jgi:hypothetical protein